jgi:hypothetical protein
LVVIIYFGTRVAIIADTFGKENYFKSYDEPKARPVGNVPYVAKRVNDSRATKQNTPVRK